MSKTCTTAPLPEELSKNRIAPSSSAEITDFATVELSLKTIVPPRLVMVAPALEALTKEIDPPETETISC